MEANRKRIFQKGYELNGEHATVGHNDIPYVLFGGTKTFRDGSTLQLQNSYSKSLSARRLQSAIAKCGYVPATRAALESGKLRHE
jgi:hypothetical protein